MASLLLLFVASVVRLVITRANPRCGLNVSFVSIEEDKYIGSMAFFETIEISFDLQINSLNVCSHNNYCHILDIFPRLPLIMLTESATTFTAEFLSNPDYYNTGVGRVIDVINNTDFVSKMIDGEYHHFYLEYTPTRRKIAFDSVTYLNVNSTNNISQVNTRDIYAADVGENQFIVDGNIKNLCIGTRWITSNSTTEPIMDYIQSDWQISDNVSIVSSPKCPSFAGSNISTTGLIKENKICISHSYKELFDGQYVFQSYNHDLNASIFLHNGTNSYISAQITSNNYEYNIHSFSYNNITKARCIIAKSTASVLYNADDLRMCITKWQIYEGDEWNSDTNMVSVACQNRCMRKNDLLQINNGVFEYHSFNATRGTPIFYCSESLDYLYGWIWSPPYMAASYGSGYDHVIQIGTDPNSPNCWSYCGVNNSSGDYIFSFDDCTTDIFSFDGNDWFSADDWILELCDNDTFDNQQIDEKKVCINGATNSDINGEYLWLYYDAAVGGSLYLGANGLHIAPFMDAHSYYWVIGDNYMIYMRCIISDAVQGYIFDVNDCLNEWEITVDDVWVKDSNVFMTECTDICISGHNKTFIPDGAIFSYNHFNEFMQVNVYFCEECNDDAYLYGWTYASGNHFWFIGPSSGATEYWSYCHIAPDANYTLNIEACLSARSVEWITKWKYDDVMIVSKCHAADKVCMLIGSNATKEYTVSANLAGFALGFDVNMASSDTFIVEYSCGESNVFTELTIFEGDSLITNIMYQLPTNACNYQNSIAIRFKPEEYIYVDNVYLYYNTTNILFIDEMKTHTNWDISDMNRAIVTDAAESDYCPSDGSCLRLDARANITESVSIMTSIETSIELHKYKDFNLKWYALTTGLREGSYFFVEYQCDKNYLYSDDLCLLKQYDSETDCTEISCAEQSYNLPAKCDFSSQIIIKLTLRGEESLKSAAVYLNDVTLSHSDVSGLSTSECVYTTTASPIMYTIAPTIMYTTTSPTNHPSTYRYTNTSPIIYTTTSNEPMTSDTTTSPTKHPSVAPSNYPSTYRYTTTSNELVTSDTTTSHTKHSSVDADQTTSLTDIGSTETNPVHDDRDTATEDKWGFLLNLNLWVLIAVGAVICTSVVYYIFIRNYRNTEIDDEDIMVQLHVQHQDVPAENNADRELMKMWLTATVGFPQYYDTFIAHAYDSLKFISNISTKEELAEIGIKIKGHQTHLMVCIKQLKEAAAADENDDLQENEEKEGENGKETKAHSESVPDIVFENVPNLPDDSENSANESENDSMYDNENNINNETKTMKDGEKDGEKKRNNNNNKKNMKTHDETVTNLTDNLDLVDDIYADDEKKQQDDEKKQQTTIPAAKHDATEMHYYDKYHHQIHPDNIYKA